MNLNYLTAFHKVFLYNLAILTDTNPYLSLSSLYANYKS